MPRPPRTSGRYPHRPQRQDDDDDSPRGVNPAAIVAILAVVVGGSLLVWVMSGGPTRRPAPPPPPVQNDPVVRSPVTNPTSINRPPRAEIRVRVDPRQPAILEYSGAFSTDPDLQDEDRLTYAWDFGDGTDGVTLQRGVHTYRKSGTYMVRLTVRDPAGAESSAQQKVDIAPSEYQVTGRAREGEQPGLDARWIPLQGQQRFGALDAKWGEGTTFTVDKVDLDRRPRDEWYALRFSGFLQIPTEGLWTFSLTSDDGSRLVLDGKTVLNMDDHQSARTVTRMVEVKAPGLVPFRLDYYQGDGGQELSVEWSGPELPRQQIPASAFVRPAD